VNAPSRAAPPQTKTAFAPASLSNLGPGFDTLGLALGGIGDTIEAWRTDEPGVRVVPSEDPSAPTIPLDPTQNTAAVAAAQVLDEARRARSSPSSSVLDGGGIALRIEKGIPIGSGIGGSAASAAAGAGAANQLLDEPFGKEALVEAVLAGEEIASGSRHGDNALPALLGGLLLVSPENPSVYRRLALPAPLPVALVVPDLSILTSDARNILPERVARTDATATAAALAFMVDAFRCGDYETVGECMMSDRLVEPARARLVPCYEAVRRAAMEAGALGCALTGSGPALFALAESDERAAAVADAMQQASREAGVEAARFVTRADDGGLRRGGCAGRTDA
jgi:homoserine kinase